MTGKRMYIIFSLIVATVSLAIIFDHRRVNLEYIDSLKISPSITDDVFAGCAWNVCRGSAMQDCFDSTEELLFTISKKRFKIEPRKNQFQDDTIYYYGIGCDIDTINYFYHSRYINAVDDSRVFKASIFAGATLPGRNLIIIYKGDVFASGLY